MKIQIEKSELDRLKAIESAAIKAAWDLEHLGALQKVLSATPEQARAQAAKQARYLEALEKVAEAARDMESISSIRPNESNYAYRQRLTESVRESLANLDAVKKGM